MARKWGKSHMAWVRSHRSKRNRSRRANPWPVAGMVVNARRRGRKRYSANPRRRRGRRNPVLFGGGGSTILGISIPPANQILYAGAGFIAPPFVENAIRPFLPASLQTGMGGKYLVKGGAVAAVCFGARMIGGAAAAKAAALGGILYIVSSAWADFAAPYFNAPMLPAGSNGVNAYVQPARGGVNAYVSSAAPTFTTLGMPSAAFSGGTSGAVGGTAARFKRY